MRGPMSFDEYCEQHGVRPDEYGQAFAAYLHEITGGEWDGAAVRVSPGAASSTAGRELQEEAPDDDEPEHQE